MSLDLAGAAVRGGGDADMDGVADLAIAAPLHDSAGPSAGVVFVLYGTPAGPFSLARSDLYLHRERPQDQLGHGIDGMGGALAWAGDVDLACGDDLRVGSPRHDAGGTDAGAAWLLYSRCW